MNLVNPYRRAEIIDYLNVLTSREKQLKYWIEYDYSGTDIEYDCLDFTIHFFFDDTLLFKDVTREIGNSLKSEIEAEALSNVLKILDGIIDELGDVEDSQYLKHPKWDEVIKQAQVALPVFQKNETEN